MDYIINNDGTVSAVVGGQSYTFGKDHPSYDKLIGCLQRRNTEHFEASYDIVSRINEYCEGYVNADSGELNWDGIPMPDLFTDRIMSMIQEGFPFKNTFCNLSKIWHLCKSGLQSSDYRGCSTGF